MADRQQKRQPKGGEGGSEAMAEERAGAERAFDLWLHRSLHRLYDGVAKEPLPPELLDLIEADRAARRGK